MMFTSKILILDDDRDFLEGVKTILEDAGYSYIATADSKTIQQKVRSYHPHLLILDIFLEEYNGDKIAKLLKNAKDTQNLPILLISSSTDLPKIARSVGLPDYL